MTAPRSATGHPRHGIAWIVLLATTTVWLGCTSLHGPSTKSGKQSKTSADRSGVAASAETSPAPAAEPAVQGPVKVQGSMTPTAPATVLPGTPEYNGDRIREIEQSLRPLTPIPTPTQRTAAAPARPDPDALPSVSRSR